MCTSLSSTTPCQSDASANDDIVTAVDDSGCRQRIDASDHQMLFSFLRKCVSNITSDERDPLLPGERQVARAILLAVHAETTTSTR